MLHIGLIVAGLIMLRIGLHCCRAHHATYSPVLFAKLIVRKAGYYKYRTACRREFRMYWLYITVFSLFGNRVAAGISFSNISLITTNE